ncbi:hypothetical protein KR054_008096 [Drosophila jambulina]|nr:hypothetical protein KR054_008096 [Drosophila jambulina]
MKFLGLCCLLILALLGCLPAPGSASPSRHTGPGSRPFGPSTGPYNPNPQPRPFIYDSPIPRPGPKTMYA